MTEKDWPTVPVIGHWIIWVYRGVHGPIKGLQDARVLCLQNKSKSQTAGMMFTC